MNDQERRNLRERGQGMTSYALILALIGVVALAVLTALGNSTGEQYEAVNCGLEGDTSGDCAPADTDEEEEREDPCPDMIIFARRARCSSGPVFQIIAEVRNCPSVQLLNPPLPDIRRDDNGTRVLFNKWYGRFTSTAPAYCTPTGSHYGTSTIALQFDHDGTGDFITNQTFTITR